MVFGRNFTLILMCRPIRQLLVILYLWQAHGFKEIQAAFLQSGLLKLLVKKCSKGTGFSKTWLLRDLEVRE